MRLPITLQGIQSITMNQATRYITDGHDPRYTRMMTIHTHEGDLVLELVATSSDKLELTSVKEGVPASTETTPQDKAQIEKMIRDVTDAAISDAIENHDLSTTLLRALDTDKLKTALNDLIDTRVQESVKTMLKDAIERAQEALSTNPAFNESKLEEMIERKVEDSLDDNLDHKIDEAIDNFDFSNIVEDQVNEAMDNYDVTEKVHDVVVTDEFRTNIKNETVKDVVERLRDMLNESVS